MVVDFTKTTIEMEAEEPTKEWYGNLVDTLNEEELQEISSNVIDNYSADKDSRAEWESMFERGFDLVSAVRRHHAVSSGMWPLSQAVSPGKVRCRS